MRGLIRVAGSLLLLGGLTVGALALIPAERIAGIAIGRFEALTGRKLVLEGAVRPSLWPVLGVQTGPVSLSNADWSDQGPMFAAASLEIGVDLAALIGGEVKVTGIEAVEPRLVLERAADGRQNWVFGGTAGGSVTQETPGVGSPFTLEKAVIRGGEMLFIDHGSGVRINLTGMEATAAIPDYEGEAGLTMAAVMNGQDFEAAVKLGAFRAFLDGEAVALKLALTAGDAQADFDGTAGWNPMVANGRLDADLGQLSEFAALAGTTAPALPAGLGREDARIAGVISLDETGLMRLAGGQVVLDGTPMQVEARLEPGKDRPRVVAQITAGALDLSALSGDAGGGAQGGAAAEGWPRDTLDMGGLSALDADVRLAAESLDLGVIRTGPVQAALTLDRARAVIDIARISAYSGTIAGQFVLNARSGLSVGGDLAFADMALQPLLQDLGGYDRLIGTGDLRVKFLGVGNSVDAIMRSLSGDGNLSLTKGELRGLDIAGMIRTLDTGYVGEGQKTIFDSVAGSFAMAGGNLTNQDLKMVTPLIAASGKGRVGLGARDLDYRIQATAFADAQGQGGLTAPLMITGPWAKPRFALDMKALADQELADEKAALEAAAKAKLEAELGIAQQEGESLEDAARRRAEEALQKEADKLLKGLLGGN